MRIDSISMASLSMASLLCLYLSALSCIRFVSATSFVCPLESDIFVRNLLHQCSASISSNPPLEVDGNFLDRALASKQTNTYSSVLFYASWCPFSRSLRSKFDNLSSMFREIEHFAVEESNALPSIFSRYGIHSLPSILIVNQTSRVRYRGPKELLPIMQFYERTTGLKPVQHIAGEDPIQSVDSKDHIMPSWERLSLNEIVKREPYLAFAVLFLCLRVLLLIFPEVLSRLQAFWVSYVPHLNLEIFGETSQLLGRALHMIDIRRIWTKLRLCKTRNFHQGAKNARVWASSLASVSLGESSSGRSSSSS